MKNLIYVLFLLFSLMIYSELKTINLELKPYTERVKKMINSNELTYSIKEKKILDSLFTGKNFSQSDMLKIIKNEEFSKNFISTFLSFFIEKNLYDESNLILIDEFIKKYDEYPSIIGLYLWYDNNLADKAPSFWLDPCMVVLLNENKKNDKEALFGEIRNNLNSCILVWVAKNKNIHKYKYFILNLPFDDKFLFAAFEPFGVSYSMTKEVLNIKEGEHYDSLFDWYYEKIIVPANLELEWFELLEKRETQTNLALKSKEKFLKKEKKMFLEKQNEILELRKNKK